MKLFTGWVAAAGLVVASASAQAQLLAQHAIGSPSTVLVSDVDGPYAAMPPEVPPPPRYGRVPSLLPPMEVYTVLRENGFLPLGAPRQRGFVYTIAVIDHGGEDGRLLIDARDGHIIRFVPAYRMGNNFDDELATYGPPLGPIPPVIQARVPRPPAPIPHVANRVPVPKRSPLATARPADTPAPSEAAAPQPAPTQPAPAQAATAPAPAGQTAAVAPKQAEAQAAPQTPPPADASTVGKATTPAPAVPAILPTQEMPKVQGLE